MLSSVSTIQPLTMPANLPDDINQLKQIIAQLHQQVNDLSQDNQTQAEEISELKTQVEYMREQLNLSKSKRFGKQSEKVPRGTFNEAEQQAKAEPKHHKKGKQKLPEHLERETRVYTLDAPVCDCCQQSMHACGTQESEQLKIIPEKVSVIRHQQTKYACRSCEQTQTKSQIITASKPAQPIPGSVASPQALAAVVTAKYCDALPLYRQEDILKRGGLSISRTTLANWCIKAGQIVEPMVACFKQNLLASTVASADETTVQVLDEPGKDASSKSYMWVYRSSQWSFMIISQGAAMSIPNSFYKVSVAHYNVTGIRLTTISSTSPRSRAGHMRVVNLMTQKQQARKRPVEHKKRYASSVNCTGLKQKLKTIHQINDKHSGKRPSPS